MQIFMKLQNEYKKVEFECTFMSHGVDFGASVDERGIKLQSANKAHPEIPHETMRIFSGHAPNIHSTYYTQSM